MVIRKSNADVKYLLKRAGRKSRGVTNDQQIKLKGIDELLRLVAYTDLETGQKYRFVTNAHHLKAAEIATIYKERWQIEQFFIWIKQNLKIKTFLKTEKGSAVDSSQPTPPTIRFHFHYILPRDQVVILENQKTFDSSQ